MTIYEAEVPGVGHKFELELDKDERVSVLIHHDGKREIYHRPSKNADSEKLLSFTGKQARQLGSILEGAYFQPVEMDEVQVPLGEAIIEWVDVDPSSQLVGQSLREANIREQAGVSIIAIQRGEETIANPAPDTTIEGDDILVAIGTREEQRVFSDLINSDASGSSQA
ncbi:cation:proton antiporter regulatory subunit [Halopelagius fulvigenes]|uniref:Cation:proton antiporter regulatory subunit n=1 Tax=Halopelagius fulvigenes TaxID=1198324 RepID=A0ABD5TZC1_9EURY